MQTAPWKRAIVVGASSGIGAALSRALLHAGCEVALVARREEHLRALAASSAASSTPRVYPHDVRRTAEVPALFQRITAELGGLDLVIYAAGVMPPVGAHQYPTATDIDTIETNLSGAIAWLNEAAHRFDRAGSGTIIGIGSVAGDRGRIGNPAYNATKAALASYLESLRNRLSRRGVRVLTVKPGYVDTPLLHDTSRPTFIPVISADEAAAQILDAASSGRRVIYVPGWWRFIMALTRAIPAPLFERLTF